jgi:hypothetical protein
MIALAAKFQIGFDRDGHWISSAAEEKFTDPIRLSDPALAS